MNIAQIRTYAAPNKDFPQGDSVEMSFMPADTDDVTFGGSCGGRIDFNCDAVIPAGFSCEGWDIFVPTGGRLEIRPFEPYSWSRREEESDIEMARRERKG